MNQQQFPFVSIIIPVRNEEEYIKACLDRVFSQNYPKEQMEIIVVDGMSEDRTIKIVEEYAIQQGKGDGLKVVLKQNPKKTPYAGVNIGILAATGEIIARVDARAILPQDYIAKCVSTLLETGADNVGGMQLQIGKSLIQKAIAIATNHWFGTGGAKFRSGKKSGFVDTVYLGCFRREIFNRVGLFDESGPVISEDAEMNYRIRKAGGKVYFNKDIVVQYWAKENLCDLWKQYFIYGGAKAHTFLKIKRFTAFRQFFPLIFIFLFFILVLLAIFNKIFLVPAALMSFGYVAVDVIVSLMLAIKNRTLKFFPMLLLIFPTIHLAWVSGFLVRLKEGSKPGQHWRKFQ